MSKKIIIMILCAILIIFLAVFTGIKLSKKTEEKTNAEPVSEATIMPSPTPEESPTPNEIEMPSPTPIPTATPIPNINKDVTSMNSSQKQEYAIEIAKSNWEKLGTGMRVSYDIDQIVSDTEYIVSVRNDATVAVQWYRINISKGTCEDY